MPEVRRRELIALLGSAAAWPLAARAQQQGERVRRIGILMNLAADDPEGQARVAAFLQGLQLLPRSQGNARCSRPRLARRAELQGYRDAVQSGSEKARIRRLHVRALLD
jgi:putative ABC transport system substrate-binding protein